MIPLIQNKFFDKKMSLHTLIENEDNKLVNEIQPYEIDKQSVLVRFGQLKK